MVQQTIPSRDGGQFTVAEDHEHCCLCGKALAPARTPRLAVNIDNTTGLPIAPEAEPAHGQWGFLPVGRACARRLTVAVWREA